MELFSIPVNLFQTRSKDDTEAATEGRIAFMTEPKVQHRPLPAFKTL